MSDRYGELRTAPGDVAETADENIVDIDLTVFGRIGRDHTISVNERRHWTQ